jgi:alpha-galactosidase
MLAAPLIAGTDVRNMSEATRAILTNHAVIAVNQDALGIQGFPHRKEEGLEFWFKPLANDAWAFVILNRNKEARRIRFDWAVEHVEDALNKRRTEFDTHAYRVRNLFAGTAADSTTRALQVTVSGHDVAMYLLERQ